MRKLQTQGCHHIMLVGTDRQTSIDFWEGVLGMPFVLEQPNLDRPREPPVLRSGRRRLVTSSPPTNGPRSPAARRRMTRPHDSLSDDRSPKAAYR